jgi:Pyruvate/2-oxoacid:ferredoxin oxidoreductase delta subunit
MSDPEAKGSEAKASEYFGQTIPVHVELSAREIVLAQPEMRALLEAAELIAVGDCGCRKVKGAEACERPLEVCLAVDAEAKREIATEGWREIALGEALAVLESSHRAGLVHLAYRKANEAVTLVCSCCPCCCVHFNALKGHDYHEAIAEAAFSARRDADTCVGCGTCTERCAFGAFTWAADGERPEFCAARCFGCGLCVGTCPSGAIAFVRR